VGLEYERLGLDMATGKAAPYSGDRGVEAVLRGMSERFGWEPDLEADRIIGLNRGDSHVTLEPGGQLELSGKVHPDIGRLRSELACFLRESVEVSRPLGIAWAPLGLQPLTSIEEIEWVPKSRYRLMAPYLGARGSLAHHMMKGTAGVQLNFDYGDEEDAVVAHHHRRQRQLSPVCRREDRVPFATRPHLDRHRSGAVRPSRVRLPR
jgi:glutamate--cysteine ligase